MAEKHCMKSGASDTLLLHLDVTDSGSIVSALKKAVRKFGGIDVLVNNAGQDALIYLKTDVKGHRASDKNQSGGAHQDDACSHSFCQEVSYQYCQRRG